MFINLFLALYSVFYHLIKDLLLSHSFYYMLDDFISVNAWDNNFCLLVLRPYHLILLVARVDHHASGQLRVQDLFFNLNIADKHLKGKFDLSDGVLIQKLVEFEPTLKVNFSCSIRVCHLLLYFQQLYCHHRCDGSSAGVIEDQDYLDEG